MRNLSIVIVLLVAAFSAKNVFFEGSKNLDESIGLARRLDDLGDSKTAERKFELVKEVAHKEVKLERQEVQAKSSFLPTSSNVVDNNKSALKAEEDKELNLIDVYNAKKYKKNLTANAFNGSLSLRNGNIETLEVELPNDESISINYSSLEGNTFTYSVEGVESRGVIFKSAGQKNLYIVSLNGGKFDGTRLKFSTEEVDVEAALDTYQIADEEQEERVENGEEVVLSNTNANSDLQERFETEQLNIEEDENAEEFQAAAEESGFNFSA